MITLDNIPLLTDAYSEAGAFLRTYQPMDELRQFGGEPVSRISSLNDSHGIASAGIGLPLPNYTAMPVLEPNQLYWPTGAARWSAFYGYIREDHLGQLLYQGLDSVKTLKFGDENSKVPLITAKMWVLPPRPISSQVGAAAVWLLPLVDERFWWQFKHVGDMADVTTNKTWAELITTLISTQLGIGDLNPAVSVHADYLHPDATELFRQYKSIPQMLDAVLHSVGMRLVRWPNGTVKIHLPSEAVTQINANYSSGYSFISGGEFDTSQDRPVPKSVTVTFPKYADCHAFTTGERVKKERLLTDSDTKMKTSIPGTTKLIHSTLFADFTQASLSADNDADLGKLATKIANSYYQWLEHQHDVVFHGAKPYNPTGFDDAVIWTWAHTKPNGDYVATTRVWTQPMDFGVEQQLSQGQDLIVLGDNFVGYGPNGIHAATGHMNVSLTPGQASDIVPCEWDGTHWIPIIKPSSGGSGSSQHYALHVQNLSAAEVAPFAPLQFKLSHALNNSTSTLDAWVNDYEDCATVGSGSGG